MNAHTPEGQPPGVAPGMKPTTIRPQATPPVVVTTASGNVRKPTVMGGGAHTPQPTRITAPSEPSPGSVERTPTAVKPTAFTSPPPPREVLVSAPTEMPGVKRKRIGIKLDDLRRQNPKTDESVLATALSRIHATNVSTLDDNQCILWGNDTQKMFGKWVNDNLALSQASVITDSVRQTNILTTVLGSIDLQKLLGKDKGLFSRLFRNEGEILEDFDQAQTEIQQAIVVLDGKQTSLLEHQDKLQALQTRLKELETKVEVEVITAYFLAEHLRTESGGTGELKRLADLLAGRSMALTQTLLQTRSNFRLLEVQVEQPLELIRLIQNVILVMVPDWLSGYAVLKAAVESQQQVTRIQIDELVAKQKHIIGELPKVKNV